MLFYSRRSWSQEGEDLIVSNLFPPDKYNGFYVDIGAYHPWRFSNTHYFYRRGWHGINIDPTLSPLFRIFRRRDRNIVAGISRLEGKDRIFRFSDPALNTFDPDRMNEIYETTNYRIRGTRMMQMLRLDLLLDDEYPIPKIDLIDIDVEGREMDVLRSNDWERHRANVVIIENKEKDEDIHQFMKDIGYGMAAATWRTEIWKDVVLK